MRIDIAGASHRPPIGPAPGEGDDAGLINTFILNPDGRTATAQVQGAKSGRDDHADDTLTELSVVSGQPTGRSIALPGDSFFVKVDASGRHFLQIIDGRLGRVDGDRFSWLSKARDCEDAAW